MESRASMRESRLSMLRSSLHPLVSVLLPFSFVQALDALVRGGILPGTIPAPPPAFLLVVLVTGVSRTVVSNALGTRRVTGFFPRIREALLTFVCVAALLLLLGGGPFRGDWNPLGPALVWPLVLCGLQWLLTLRIQDALRPRELFLSLLGGATGHALVRAARDASGEATESQQALRRLRGTTLMLEAFILVPFVLLMAARVVVSAPALSAWDTVRIFIHVICGCAAIVLFGLFSYDQLESGAGVDHGPGRDLRRIGGSLAGIGVILIASLFLSAPPAVGSLAALGRFFLWLLSLLPVPRSLPAASPGNGEQPEIPRGPLLPPTGLSRLTESDLLVRIFHVARIGIAIAAGIALLYFVIRPLLLRDTRASAGQMHPLKTLLRCLSSLGRFLLQLPHAISQWMRASGRGLASVPRAIVGSLRAPAAGAKARPGTAGSRARHRAAQRAVRDYQRLARWGRKAGVAFTAAEGPAEYARRLERAIPSKGSVLREAALLFEQLIYAEAPAAHAEQAFSRMVDGIVK